MQDPELTIEKRWLLLARLDPEDFRRFYEKYCDAVYRFCLRRTLDLQVAEDLTSETFLRAQRNLWRFRWQRRRRPGPDRTEDQREQRRRGAAVGRALQVRS